MKAHDSLAPDPGKVGGATAEKQAGGYLEKEYADHSADYVPGGTDGGPSDDGGGYGGDGGYDGGSGGSPDTETDAPDSETDTGDEAPDGPLYAESGGDGDDTPVTDEFADTEHPTKPGLPETEDPERPAEPPAPPPTTVSIDVEAMTRLVAAMERAGEQIVALREELRTILSGVRLDTAQTARFDQVQDWIAEQLPGLRRRLAMAQDLLGEGGVGTQPAQHRPVPRPYAGDESLISTKPVQESYDAGRDTAQRFATGDAESTRQLVADLRANRHDPYYAREFAHTADPETLVRTVVAAGDDELAELTAATVATASRGTGELAPPAGYEEQWAALRDSDDPAVAAAAAQLRPA